MERKIIIPTEDLSEEEKKALEESLNMSYSGRIEPNTPKERLKRILSRLLG